MEPLRAIAAVMRMPTRVIGLTAWTATRPPVVATLATPLAALPTALPSPPPPSLAPAMAATTTTATTATAKTPSATLAPVLIPRSLPAKAQPLNLPSLHFIVSKMKTAVPCPRAENAPNVWVESMP